MEIALGRIDDRLIHGQVVMGWIPHVKASVVVVASDSAAADDTLKALMQMALPEGVELSVLPIAEAAATLSDKKDARRALVLMPGPQEALALLLAGAPLSEINVGGLHYTAGKVQLGKAIFLSDTDKAALRQIAEKGVRLEGRALPGDERLDIVEMIGR
jgi:mannose/fructose/N-acetylgalactosamine-specific phosphotransferase system component IIB